MSVSLILTKFPAAQSESHAQPAVAVTLSRARIAVEKLTNARHVSFLNFPPGPFETFHLYMPGTTINLAVHYFYRLPISPHEIYLTVGDAMDHMVDHYAQYGDGPLDSVEDPYVTPHRIGVNCTLAIESFRLPGTPWLRIPNHLTYKIAINTLRRLAEWLLMEAHHASILVQVVDKGLTGSYVTAGYIWMKPIM